MELALYLPWLLLLPWLFMVGAVVGSFLNVCIYRIPQHPTLLGQLRGLVWPGSQCPGCGKRILRRDNIPVLGWLMLRGRCRNCRMRISPRYPLIELFNGLLFVLLYVYEISPDWTSTVTGPFTGTGGIGWPAIGAGAARLQLHLLYVYHLVLLEALVVATFIDLDHRIIPDASTLPAMIVGVLGAWAAGTLYLVPVWFQDPSLMRTLDVLFPEAWQWLLPDERYPAWISRWPHLHGLAVSLAGLIVGGGVVWGVRLIGRWALREEAMGFGDVILMALIGSFLGWQPVLIVFFLAPMCARAVVLALWLVKRQRVIPYGPYLSFAALVVLFGWKRIWPACERFFDFGILLPVVAVIGAFLLAGSLLFVQAVKRMLGFKTEHEAWVEEWRPADQLLHYAGNKIDEQRAQQGSSAWPGVAAGRGTLCYNRWRHGAGRL